MKHSLLTLLMLIFCFTISAEDVFRINVGRDYKSYKDQDLKRRVWELERAVWQLQQRIYSLESKPVSDGSEHEWVCTLRVFNNTYSETGKTQATAKMAVIKSCTEGETSGFQCRDPKCEK